MSRTSWILMMVFVGIVFDQLLRRFPIPWETDWSMCALSFLAGSIVTILITRSR